MSALTSYRYTDKELAQLLDSLVVLIDRREQACRHIRDYLDRKEVVYENRSLDFGDYSFYLPADPELGIVRPVHFDKQLAIERKANLEELSRNFAQDRARFERELIRAQGAGAKLILLVEVGDGYGRMVNGEYNTEYRPQSFVATLFSFMHRYDIQVFFVAGRYSGNVILYCFRYWLRERLK